VCTAALRSGHAATLLLHFSGCMKSLSYALLFRGELFRWGCSKQGISWQMNVIASHIAMLVKPLEHAGHTVSDFVAHGHLACGAAAMEDFISSHGARLRIAAEVPAQSQPGQMRSSLDRLGPLLAQHDVLIVTRLDLTLLSPMGSWACNLDDDKVLLASRCERSNWERYNCSADHLFVVPQRHFGRFNASVGRVLAVPGRYGSKARCCFHESCMQGSGHGCYNVLQTLLPRGASQIDFCWPPPGAGMRLHDLNSNYRMPQCGDVNNTDLLRGLWRCQRKIWVQIMLERDGLFNRSTGKLTRHGDRARGSRSHPFWL